MKKLNNKQLENAKSNELKLEKLLNRVIPNGGREREALKTVFVGKQYNSKEKRNYQRQLYSKTLTNRLAKIESKLDAGKLNLKLYVKFNKAYQENRENLGKTPSLSDIAASLTRTDFYYKNKDLVLEYNSIPESKITPEIASKYGLNEDFTYEQAMDEIYYDYNTEKINKEADIIAADLESMIK